MSICFCVWTPNFALLGSVIERIVVVCQSKPDSLKWVEILQAQIKSCRQPNFNNYHNLPVSDPPVMPPYQTLTLWIRSKIAARKLTIEHVRKLSKSRRNIDVERWAHVKSWKVKPRTRKVECVVFPSMSKSEEVLFQDDTDSQLMLWCPKIPSPLADSDTISSQNCSLCETASSEDSVENGDRFLSPPTNLSFSEEMANWKRLGAAKSTFCNFSRSLCIESGEKSLYKTESLPNPLLRNGESNSENESIKWIESNSDLSPFCAPTLFDYEDIQTRCKIPEKSPTPKIKAKRSKEKLMIIPTENYSKIASTDVIPLIRPSKSFIITSIEPSPVLNRTCITHVSFYVNADAKRPSKTLKKTASLPQKLLCCTPLSRSQKRELFSLGSTFEDCYGPSTEATLYRSTLHAHWCMKAILPPIQEDFQSGDDHVYYDIPW